MSRIRGEDGVIHVDTLEDLVQLLQRRSAEVNPEQDVRRVTVDTTLDSNDDLVLVDATAGVVTVTLPFVDDAQRKLYTVKKIDAGGNAVTVQGGGAETIDGGTISLANQYDLVMVLAERDTESATTLSNWWKVGT